MFMSPSRAIINVSLLRAALFPSHAFSFNIGNRQGRGVSRVQIGNKIVKYLSQDYHEINRKFTSREIITWGITCRNILTVKLLVTSSGTLTGRGLFAFLGSVFAPNVRQISSITVQTLDTNLVASRRIEGEEASLPVNLCRSKTSLLKTSNANVELMPVFTGIKEKRIYLLF